MDSPATVITRARSDQLELAAARQALSRTASADTIPTADVNVGPSLLRKPSLSKKIMGSPSGRKGSHHIRKTRSGQLKLDMEDVSSGAALSRASSASLGFSFSFTGFTAPPEDIIADLSGFSDDEIAVDPEGGVTRKKIISEPTLPIYLKSQI